MAEPANPHDRRSTYVGRSEEREQRPNQENVIAELLALQMKKDRFYIKFVCACCGQEWQICGESDDVIPPRPQQITGPHGCAEE
jgi:hypothetical protein